MARRNNVRTIVLEGSKNSLITPDRIEQFQELQHNTRSDLHISTEGPAFANESTSTTAAPCAPGSYLQTCRTPYGAPSLRRND